MIRGLLCVLTRCKLCVIACVCAYQYLLELNAYLLVVTLIDMSRYRLSAAVEHSQRMNSLSGCGDWRQPTVQLH